LPLECHAYNEADVVMRMAPTARTKNYIMWHACAIIHYECSLHRVENIVRGDRKKPKEYNDRGIRSSNTVVTCSSRLTQSLDDRLLI